MEKQIILYTQPGCPKCEVLRKKLSQKEISFNECSSVDEMLKLNIKATPVLGVNGILLGFSSAVKWINNQETV